MQTSTTAFRRSSPAPTTRDTAGQTLGTVRSQALRMAPPAGYVAVIGRLYPHGSLSATWAWAVRAQVPRADGRPGDEQIADGSVFRGVEVVDYTAPVKVRIPW